MTEAKRKREKQEKIAHLDILGGVVERVPEEVGKEKVILCLKTLGEFDLAGHYLLDLVQDYVVGFLNDDSSAVRIGLFFFFSLFIFFPFLFLSLLFLSPHPSHRGSINMRQVDGSSN